MKYPLVNRRVVLFATLTHVQNFAAIGVDVVLVGVRGDLLHSEPLRWLVLKGGSHEPYSVSLQLLLQCDCVVRFLTLEVHLS